MLSKNLDDDGLAKTLFVRQVIISIAKNIAKSASVNRAGTKFKDRGIKIDGALIQAYRNNIEKV